MSLSRTRAASCFGVRLRLPTVIASVVALALLPMEASHAGFFDFLKGSSKKDSSKKSDAAKSEAAPKHATPTRRAASPEQSAAPKSQDSEEARPSKPVAVARKCDPAKFRLLVDVGHTEKSEGALSARNVPEFDFNLHLSQRIVAKLKSEGFALTRLLVTEGGARPSLATRVAAANNWHADLFLAIHHDSVPDKMMENWEFEGKKSHFSDRFSGYGVFVSKSNPYFEESFQFGKLIGNEMRARGIKFASQYTLPIMGKYRHDLLDKDAGVYRYDRLIVLMKTQMPAALLEAGSIINRDEELEMVSPERQDKTAAAVTAAVKEYCGLPPAAAPADAQAKADH